MKLTWFSASCFRLYVGGRIVVTDPEAAPQKYSRREVTSGADQIVVLGDATLARFEAAGWRPRRPQSVIAAEREEPHTLFRFGVGGLFVDAPGEAALILSPADASWGRFADNAVVVLFGDAAGLADTVASLVGAARPKLIALAAAGLDETGFDAIAAAAGGTALQFMEEALALEA